MPTVQLLRNGQITLPAKFRKELELEKGDIIEASLQDGRIILTPVTLVQKSEGVKRAQAKEKFFSKVDELRERTKDVPLEEIQEAISEALAKAKEDKIAAG